MSAPAVREMAADEVAARRDELAAFEREFVYPLGRDTFRIDHGSDYLAFFRSLGTPAVLVSESQGRLRGICVAVERSFAEPTWYLCDLKVAAGCRGLGLARRLMQACARRCLAGGGPAFGVSMDPATGKNRMARAAARFAGAAIDSGPRLAIWSLRHGDWQRARAAVERLVGPVTFFDPAGTKDIVLGSTGRPMALLHAQHGEHARPGGGPARAGHVHMIASPVGDPLAAALRGLGLEAGASATVLHRGMRGFRWRDLLTSDI